MNVMTSQKNMWARKIWMFALKFTVFDGLIVYKDGFFELHMTWIWIMQKTYFCIKISLPLQWSRES